MREWVLRHHTGAVITGFRSREHAEVWAGEWCLDGFVPALVSVEVVR